MVGRLKTETSKLKTLPPGLRYHRHVNKRTLSRLAVFGVVVFLSLGFACRSGGPPDVRAERVVMVSYDSLGADVAWRWISDGTVSSPDGLAGMAQRGFSAERLRMVDPTLTAVNHISLAAGRNAAGTGVVGNSFRRPGMPINESSSDLQDLLLLIGRRQDRRSRLRPHDGQRMTVERDEHARQSTTPCPRADLAQDGPMPPVHAVEIADGDRGAAKAFGEFL